MSESGGVKLTLTHQPKPNDPSNGLSALFERLAQSDGRQFVILAVVPVETAKRRYDGGQVTLVEIRAIEPMVDDRDIAACKSLMEAATRLRLDRKPKAPDQPDDMLAELDEAVRNLHDDEQLPDDVTPEDWLPMHTEADNDPADLSGLAVRGNLPAGAFDDI